MPHQLSKVQPWNDFAVKDLTRTQISNMIESEVNYKLKILTAWMIRTIKSTGLPERHACRLSGVCVCAGKTFFKKKKQPVPVDLRGKDWAAQISAACAATYMFLSGGTSLSIRQARPHVIIESVPELSAAPCWSRPLIIEDIC